MIPKVKAQKTRLSKYLVEELGATLQKSQTTESEYFQLGTLKVRVSDHTYRHDNKSLNIILPLNDPNSFIIENNFVVSVLHSLKEVKNLLQSLLFIQTQCQQIMKTDYEKELLKANTEIQELKGEIYAIKLRNAELETMVETRNKAIIELAERAKSAEELALGDPTTVVEKKATILNRRDIVGDAIIIQGKAYSLRNFPANFKTKVTNIILNSKTITPLL